MWATSFTFSVHIDSMDRSRVRVHTQATDVTDVASLPLPKHIHHRSNSPSKVALAWYPHKFTLPAPLPYPATPFAWLHSSAKPEDPWTPPPQIPAAPLDWPWLAPTQKPLGHGPSPPIPQPVRTRPLALSGASWPVAWKL